MAICFIPSKPSSPTGQTPWARMLALRFSSAFARLPAEQKYQTCAGRYCRSTCRTGAGDPPTETRAARMGGVEGNIAGELQRLPGLRFGPVALKCPATLVQNSLFWSEFHHLRPDSFGGEGEEGHGNTQRMAAMAVGSDLGNNKPS